MDRRRDQTAADTDRSEIGPYLGSPRTTSGGPKKTPRPSTSEVRRFLRKRHIRRHGPPQRLDCRRHGPLGDRSLPRKSSDYIRGGKKTSTPPTPCSLSPKTTLAACPQITERPNSRETVPERALKAIKLYPSRAARKLFLPQPSQRAQARSRGRPPTYAPTHPRTHAPTPTPTEPHITHRSEGITRTPSTSRSKRRPYSTKLAFNAASDGGTATPLASWNTATM